MALGLVAYGCGGGSGADTSQTDGGSGDGGLGGGGTVPEAAAGCVPKSTPDLPDDNFEDTNCDGIDGDVAASIFVSPKGDDSADGSITHPVKTLGKGVALAATAGKVVLVTNATYPENVVVTGKATSIYGGYILDTWARTNDDKAKVAPVKGVPLEVKSVTDALTLDHLALAAPAGVDSGESSIGALVANCPNVLFRHGQITAGAGAAGATPASPAAVTTPPVPLFDGAGGSTDNSLICSCTSCNCGNVTANAICKIGASGGYYGSGTNGGRGGDSGNQIGRAPVAAESGLPAGLGGAPGPLNGSYDGQNGQPGPSGQPGASAVAGVGTVGASGYVASNSGGDGLGGGQGGGGGGGGAINSSDAQCSGVGNTNHFGAGGGGGGTGGAGGAGASGSTAGGGSIGIVSFQSKVEIDTTEITTSTGGHGGDSAKGAAGQPGLVGGKPGTDINACNCGGSSTSAGGKGGTGGSGGVGGAGGAGGGGPSIGLLSVGTAPTTKGVNINIGAGGKGGTGVSGAGGSMSGADGLASDKYTAMAAPMTDGGK